MSMYYAGGFELGLLIANDDVFEFKDNYYRINKEIFHNMSKDEAMDEIHDALYGCDSLIGHDGEYFDARYITDDNYCGAYFIPACQGKMSKELDSRELYIFINATKQPFTQGLLRGCFYASFDEIKREFQLKCGKYLPENFSYEEAIGDLEYAYFA